MKLTIIGAAGMIGRKLAEHVATHSQLNGRTVTAMTLVDVVVPEVAHDFVGTREAYAAWTAHAHCSRRLPRRKTIVRA